MYQNNSSPFQGLGKVILMLVVIGALTGLALSNTDVVNVLRNGAQAKGIEQQNTLQAQKDAVDLEYYKAIQPGMIQNQQDRLEADKAAYQKSLEQQLANENAMAAQERELQAQKAAQEMQTALNLHYVLVGSLIFITLCAGTGIAILMIQIGRSQVIKANAQTKEVEKDTIRKMREQQIEEARKRERENREKLLQPIPVTTPIAWGEISKTRVAVNRK